MSKKCLIPNCRLQKDDPGCLKLNFFQVPSNENTRKEWSNKINQYFNKEIELKKYSYVCALHFESTCFTYGGLCNILRLKKGSCPTVFENYSLKDPEIQSTNIGRDDHVNNDNQKNVSAEVTNIVSSASMNSQKTCNVSTRISFTANNNAKPQDSDLEEDENHSDPLNNLVDMEEVSQITELQDSSHSAASDDLADAKEGLQMNQTSLSSTDCSKITYEKNWINKSLANINLDSIDYDNKTLIRRVLEMAQKEVISLRRYRRVQAMRLYRAKKKVKNGASLISHMKQRHLISDEVAKILNDSVSVQIGDLFKRILQQPKQRRSFPPSLRSFATTLHFYSLKAYNYVRKTFVNCLPHPITISKWYRNIEFTSGINKASLEAIKLKVKSMKKENGNGPIFCNLVMDEMSVKKAIEIINGKEYGYVDIGKNDVEAENVLLVMVVCENGHFKIPVSHYFIKSLTGFEKAHIIKENLIALHDINMITITSLTFDGLQSNASMCDALGAYQYLQNHGKYCFLHPVTQKEIYIIYDGCHVLKLIRNALASGDDIYDNEGNVISWDFIRQLVDFQELNGLHAANKLRREHINWQDNKMNVRIAAQTFSRSVSESLTFLQKDLKIKQFATATGTAKFCALINDAFDILNSRELYHKDQYKKGISASNVKEISDKINVIIPYIETLKYANESLVIHSRKKTGFQGIIHSLKNVLNIYEYYFKINNYYLLTYKLSQDHLETFFSAVRSKGGNNNNPTCYQFTNILKKLLIHADLKESDNANCITLDRTQILRILPETWKTYNDKICDIDEYNYKPNMVSNTNCDNFYGPGANTLYIDNVVAYIAGFITRTILKRTKCFHCPLLLTDDTSDASLIDKKSRGGLIKPSEDMINICKILEKNFRLHYRSAKGIFKQMYCDMTLQIPPHLLPIHHTENPKLHRSQLIKYLIMKYYHIRINHYERQKRESRKKIRRTFTKLILFNNQ